MYLDDKAQRRLLEILESDPKITLMGTLKQLEIHIVSGKIECWCNPNHEGTGSTHASS